MKSLIIPALIGAVTGAVAVLFINEIFLILQRFFPDALGGAGGKKTSRWRLFGHCFFMGVGALFAMHYGKDYFPGSRGIHERALVAAIAAGISSLIYFGIICLVEKIRGKP